MTVVSVRSDFWKFRDGLTDLQKTQMPFAAARALTDTAKAAKDGVTAELPSIFDRPTLFTQRAIGTKSARKNDLVAEIFVKDIQADYLRLEETGGTRLPEKTALVIPVDAQRNQYGNMPKGYLQRMKARADVFSGVINGVGGFWQRLPDGRLKLLAAFEKKASYKPRFDFHGRVGVIVTREFMPRLSQRFKEAMASAFRR